MKCLHKCYLVALFVISACSGNNSGLAGYSGDDRYEHRFGPNTTYYYERVAIVNNGKRTEQGGDGHFLTITPKGVYESDKEGNSMGKGYLKKDNVYKGRSYYSGSTFLGNNLEYAFNSDFSRLNIRMPDGAILVYEATITSNNEEVARSYATPTNYSGGINTFDLDHTSINGVPARALVSGEYDGSHSSSSTTKSSSRSSYTKKYSRYEINRQADAEARAYEEFKKNPSRLSGDYYRSQRKMTKHMQEYASGK